MVDLKQKIEELAAPFLGPIDAFIIDIQIAPGEGRKVIQIYVDTDSGITVDQCAEINRQLGAALELHGAMEHSYVLQVSSPGLKKPLKLLRQYHKNIGRRFRVRFLKDSETIEVLGKLVAAEGDILTFVTDKNITYTLQFNAIIESIEELPW